MFANTSRKYNSPSPAATTGTGKTLHFDGVDPKPNLKAAGNSAGAMSQPAGSTSQPTTATDEGSFTRQQRLIELTGELLVLMGGGLVNADRDEEMRARMAASGYFVQMTNEVMAYITECKGIDAARFRIPHLLLSAIAEAIHHRSEKRPFKFSLVRPDNLRIRDYYLYSDDSPSGLPGDNGEPDCSEVTVAAPASGSTSTIMRNHAQLCSPPGDSASGQPTTNTTPDSETTNPVPKSVMKRKRDEGSADKGDATAGPSADPAETHNLKLLVQRLGGLMTTKTPSAAAPQKSGRGGVGRGKQKEDDTPEDEEEEDRDTSDEQGEERHDGLSSDRKQAPRKRLGMTKAAERKKSNAEERRLRRLACAEFTGLSAVDKTAWKFKDHMSMRRREEWTRPHLNPCSRCKGFPCTLSSGVNRAVPACDWCFLHQIKCEPAVDNSNVPSVGTPMTRASAQPGRGPVNTPAQPKPGGSESKFSVTRTRRSATPSRLPQTLTQDAEASSSHRAYSRSRSRSRAPPQIPRKTSRDPSSQPRPRAPGETPRGRSRGRGPAMKKPRTGDLENTSANEIHTLHPLTRDASGAPQLGEPSSVLSTPQMVTQLTNLEARVGTMQDTMLTISSTLEAMNLMLTRAVHVIAFPGRKKPIRSLQRFLDGMPDETPEHSPPPERSSSPANQYEPTVTHFANTS